MDYLKESYQECIGQAMPMPIQRRIGEAMLRGVPYEYFAYALQEASYAPRPSWRYAETIVNRCMREKADPNYIFWSGTSIIPEDHFDWRGENDRLRLK